MARSAIIFSLASKLLRAGYTLGLNGLVRHGLRLVPGLESRVMGYVRKIRLRQSYGKTLVPVEELQQAYRKALQMLATPGGEPIGDYLEFGVCHGTSLLCMYRSLISEGPASMRLFGFDSFEGLPPSAATDDEGTWHPGQFDSDEAMTRKVLTKQGVDWDRVELIKGWYDEVLNDVLLARFGIKRAAVIMVDCDMYLSALDALRFCGPLIGDKTIVFFDDWHQGLADRNLGERRAFDEFLAEFPHLHAEELPELRYHEGSRAFMLTRVAVPGSATPRPAAPSHSATSSNPPGTA